jgi:hypothetical protein
MTWGFRSTKASTRLSKWLWVAKSCENSTALPSHHRLSSSMAPISVGGGYKAPIRSPSPFPTPSPSLPPSLPPSLSPSPLPSPSLLVLADQATAVSAVWANWAWAMAFLHVDGVVEEAVGTFEERRVVVSAELGINEILFPTGRAKGIVLHAHLYQVMRRPQGRVGMGASDARVSCAIGVRC